MKNRKNILCVETGAIYCSPVIAAIAHNVGTSIMKWAIRHHKTINGLHFKEVA